MRSLLLSVAMLGALAPTRAFLPANPSVTVRSRSIARAAEPMSGVSLHMEPAQVLDDFLASWDSEDMTKLRTAVRRNLDYCDYNFINFLQDEMNKTKNRKHQDKLCEIMTQVNIQLRKRLQNADDQLREILEAGELKEMEEKLKKLLRLGEVDVAFMVVLNMNMRQAREAGAETAANVLQHLYTYVQQEQDALVPPQTRLLRMLLRTECDGARENILREKLLLPEDLKDLVAVPDEARMWGDAEVEPKDLQKAIADLEAEADAFGPEVSKLLREQCGVIAAEVGKVLSGDLKGLACETAPEEASP